MTQRERIMRKHFFIFIGSIAISLIASQAKPMTVYWNGDTGCIVNIEVYNSSRVDYEKAAYLTNISRLNSVGAKGYKLVSQPDAHSFGELEIWW
jgi:hypothetical protein